ncbi:hypothetical protein chiPu_0029716, partial [Chiloscyllium punctatum]|nr:hypothetical protein [Chiloscyllium punctatum]
DPGVGSQSGHGELLGDGQGVDDEVLSPVGRMAAGVDPEGEYITHPERGT